MKGKTLKLHRLVPLLFILFPLSLSAKEGGKVGVAKLQVNGPSSVQYLSVAARDALVGALIQKDRPAVAVGKTLDPDKLANPKQGGKGLDRLVTGRINVVGLQYRVLLKWVDAGGGVGQEYLQADRLQDLLPKLENFAASQLARPPTPTTVAAPVAPPAPAPAPQAPPKVETKSPKQAPREEGAAGRPVVREEPEPTPKKGKKAGEVELPLRDYDFVSDRLPFEVRSLAYGDVNGDGKKEILLTSQNKLYLYSFDQSKMELLAEFPGAKMDFFVKVDLLPRTAESPLIVLTNLRGDQASSKILKYQSGKLVPLAENIPYQMRVVERDGKEELVGSGYSATSTRAAQNIFRLAVEDEKVKTVEKLDLPWGTQLYDYDWIGGEGQGDVVRLTPEGKLMLFTQKGEKKYKKAWTSRENYGGTGNWVPVEVRNMFNEVVSDFYPIPVGVRTSKQNGKPEIFVVKNDSLLKDVVGRYPVIKDGQIFKLTLDPLGFVEAWASKKIDGSIQDYRVTRNEGRSQLMAAVRLRDPGLLGDVGRKDSVILLYHLN